jgi:predicted secreted hydrolase
MIKPVYAAVLALLLAALAPLAAAADGAPDSAGRTLSPAALLGAAGDGDFARAELPYPFRFPADHGSHDAYRTETWQLFGVLESGDRGPLGMQLSVIRMALGDSSAAAGWATGEIYVALFSITRPDGERLYTDRRLVRGGIGLAGWQADPMQLWVEDWRIGETAGDPGPTSLEVQLTSGDLRLDLQLGGRQPPVDHNRIRGAGGGSATPFIYYVEPRLQAAGRLFDGTHDLEVSGTFSIEHAWGELPLPGGPLAQDRFTLYLDDGRELFLLRSHRSDGSGTATTAGLLIGADREPLLLGGRDIELRGGDYWDSPHSGARYPLRWRLRIPGQDIDLELVAARESAEGELWSPFWAGPLRLLSASSNPAGAGLMLLNGYLEP